MYRKFFKRFLDICISLVALPFLGLELLLLAPMIYFTDRGPVFYNAERLGKNGKIFKMYKLRTMKVNAPDIRLSDGSTYNAEHDPRLTKFGGFIRKLSLDEVPQILNVFIGNMSLIGPRPDLPEHKEQYSETEARKLEVLPGITGYAQAYVRNAVPWKERLKFDVYYVEHLSFWLDIKIICKTVISVLGNKGIYVEVTPTTEESKEKEIVYLTK